MIFKLVTNLDSNKISTIYLLEFRQILGIALARNQYSMRVFEGSNTHNDSEYVKANFSVEIQPLSFGI